MNRRFVIAWVVLFVAWYIGSFVVHGVLLHADYARLARLFRSPEEATAYLPLVGTDSKRRWLRRRLFSPQRQYQRTLAAPVTVLAQIDSLPCTEHQPAIHQGHRKVCLRERRANDVVVVNVRSDGFDGVEPHPVNEIEIERRERWRMRAAVIGPAPVPSARKKITFFAFFPVAEAVTTSLRTLVWTPWPGMAPWIAAEMV